MVVDASQRRCRGLCLERPAIHQLMIACGAEPHEATPAERYMAWFARHIVVGVVHCLGSILLEGYDALQQLSVGSLILFCSVVVQEGVLFFVYWRCCAAWQTTSFDQRKGEAWPRTFLSEDEASLASTATTAPQADMRRTLLADVGDEDQTLLKQLRFLSVKLCCLVLACLLVFAILTGIGILRVQRFVRVLTYAPIIVCCAVTIDTELLRANGHFEELESLLLTCNHRDDDYGNQQSQVHTGLEIEAMRTKYGKVLSVCQDTSERLGSPVALLVILGTATLALNLFVSLSHPKGHTSPEFLHDLLFDFPFQITVLVLLLQFSLRWVRVVRIVAAMPVDDAQVGDKLELLGYAETNPLVLTAASFAITTSGTLGSLATVLVSLIGQLAHTQL